MSQEKIVLLGQSAAELIELFRSESAPSAQIREYFTNYCDCDIAEWLIAQLLANNQEVVDKVNELLEARDLSQSNAKLSILKMDNSSKRSVREPIEWATTRSIPSQLKATN